MAEYLNKSGLTTVASFVNEKLKQCPTMPIASSTLVGTIVQYIGLSTENYTKGLFYVCGQDNDTYFWQKISVNDLSLYQTKNLSAAMTINGESATTVESALTTLNSQKVDTEQNKSLMSADEHTKLAGIETGAEVNVQVDWDQTSSAAKDYIKNKPTLGTAAAKDVPASGDAGIAEVVLGSDSRLTDSRNAADVYSWAKAETKPTYTASEVGAIAATLKGAVNGVAELDNTGKVPSSQLPAYVDDVIEGYLYNGAFYAESTHETEIPGVSGKIYVDLVTNRTYRWSGSLFAEISESLALGETSSTAYRGDLGKTAYDDSQTNKTNIGSLSSLNTIVKTDLVSSINEVNTKISNKQNYIFRGTHDEWDNLSAAEKAQYDIVAFTDDGETGDITNAVTDGDMRAVTSNAVYDALNNVGGGIPTGVIVPYGGSIAPNGYLLCDGTAVSREDYAELFAVIGTSYGTGDGSTTFNVPDLRECVPVGAGQSERSSSVLKSHDTYTVGQFKDDQFQDHTHKYTKPYSGAGSLNISGSCSTASTYDTTTYSAVVTNTVYRGGTVTRGKRLGVNYIIKT